ncbi:unnamed protein product [Cladocopium goreaui]|uniref:Uncharacterized protein n=1 Tax=Cladocopium goreaui TaxID=2562237 RepID=A0A9P1GMZ4_9DINO|nr:unnamed protein product [Cladocopium goreaui]
MAPLLLFLAPFLVAAQRPDSLSQTMELAASRNLRGYKDVECTGDGSFPEGAPLCYGGELLVQKFSIKVLSHDSNGGTVDMQMQGPTTGACSGAAFQNDGNDITIADSNECNLGDSEYTVKFCPDQNQFLINIVKPWRVEVVLENRECTTEEQTFLP